MRKAWPDSSQFPPSACDLYVFMQTQTWPISSTAPTAVAFMAELAGRQAKIDRLATSVCGHFSPDSPNRIPIVALTSFIPEVACERGSDGGDMGRAAIRFLIEFANALKTKGHPLGTIELVAGSCMDGIWPGTHKAKARHFANRMTDDQVHVRLISTLKDAITQVRAEGENYDIAHFALEVEPGPLYCLRDWKTVCDLCDAIEKDDVLSSLVGVNLDIAHYRLADIPLAKVRATKKVRDRIVHAHIAGHQPHGHLGDLPLYDLNEPGDFRPWLQFLGEINAGKRAANIPQFSGFVSLELEASKDRVSIIESLEILQDLRK